MRKKIDQVFRQRVEQSVRRKSGPERGRVQASRHREQAALEIRTQQNVQQHAHDDPRKKHFSETEPGFIEANPVRKGGQSGLHGVSEVEHPLLRRDEVADDIAERADDQRHDRAVHESDDGEKKVCERNPQISEPAGKREELGEKKQGEKHRQSRKGLRAFEDVQAGFPVGFMKRRVKETDVVLDVGTFLVPGETNGEYGEKGSPDQGETSA